MENVAELIIKLPIEFNAYKNGYLLTGDTRDYRCELKGLGGNWNRHLKGWVFRTRDKENVEKFVDSKF